MDVTTLDPTDDSAWKAWFEVWEASYAADWPGDPRPRSAELRALALADDAAVRVVDLVAIDGGQVVGTARVEVPLLDNRHLVEPDLQVHPEERRHGAGHALITEAEDLARREGRTLVVGYHKEPLSVSGRSAGRGFALAHGYSAVLMEPQRELDLEDSSRRWDDLEASCRPYAKGYRLVTWQDRWPDRYLADRVLFGRRMSTDAPLGGADRREEAWDETRVRSMEALDGRKHHTRMSAVAVEEKSGRAVAFTELTVALGAPERALQGDTLVLSGHRGHRLGTLVKVANLRALAELSPGTRRVITSNAQENTWMIAVNDALGCKVVSYGLTWQKRLG